LRSSYHKLTSNSIFWLSAGFSLSHSHDEKIWDLIDGGELLTISRTHIVSTVDKTLTFADGTTLSSDALVLATGWFHPYRALFSPELAADLELPIPLEF
jgi:hypothetical protein